MKRITLVITATVICCISFQISSAQNFQEFKKMSPDQKAKLITDSLKRILNLSDLQYDKVYTTALEGIERAAPVVNSDAGKMSKGMQLRSIGNDTEDKLKLILTKQQFNLYENIKEKTIAYYRQQVNDGKIHF